MEKQIEAVKNVGEAVIDVIVKERELNGSFKNFDDFINFWFIYVFKCI